MTGRQRPDLAITLYRSVIGHPKKLKLVVRGLGLKKINQTVVRQDTPQIRGMVEKVPHLVRVKPV